MSLLDLKTQSSFLTKLPLQSPVLASLKPAVGRLPSSTVSPTQTTNKISHPIEYSRRIYSPYFSPSSVHVESRQLAQDGLSPIYQHSIAATKYFNVSVIPKLRPQSRLNLMA